MIKFFKKLLTKDVSRNEKRKIMDKKLKEIIVPELRKKGFKGTFPYFRRLTNSKIEVLGFQHSQWGSQFYINIGICPITGITSSGEYVSPNKIKPHHCSQTARVETDFNFENMNYDTVINTCLNGLKKADNWWEKTKRKKEYCMDQL